MQLKDMMKQVKSLEDLMSNVSRVSVMGNKITVTSNKEDTNHILPSQPTLNNYHATNGLDDENTSLVTNMISPHQASSIVDGIKLLSDSINEAGGTISNDASPILNDKDNAATTFMMSSVSIPNDIDKGVTGNEGKDKVDVSIITPMGAVGGDIIISDSSNGLQQETNEEQTEKISNTDIITSTEEPVVVVNNRGTPMRKRSLSAYKGVSTMNSNNKEQKSSEIATGIDIADEHIRSVGRRGVRTDSNSKQSPSQHKSTSNERGERRQSIAAPSNGSVSRTPASSASYDNGINSDMVTSIDDKISVSADTSGSERSRDKVEGRGANTKRSLHTYKQARVTKTNDYE